MEKELIDIFRLYFTIDFEKNYELRNENLLGTKIGLLPRDLVFLLFLIEKKMRVNIDKGSVKNGKFDNFNNIVMLVEKAKSFKGEEVKG